MMIPQIARGLIERYGKEGEFLFDPYCGTGTSLVEARIAGMNAAGTDINPTARIIAMAKTQNYDIDMLKIEITEFLTDLEKLLEDVDDYREFDEPELITFERLSDWFPPKTIGEICACISIIDAIENSTTQLFIRVALSECLRLVSYQRNGEFKLYRIPETDRETYYVPLYKLFNERIERNYRGCLDFMNEVDLDTEAKVFEFNTVQQNGLDLIGNRPNLVVTSPPYGDSGTTVAYAQFSWLSNAWLGLDSRSGALDRELMGGRKQDVTKLGFEPIDSAIDVIHSDKPKRAQEVMNFYHEYLTSMHNVADIVADGGYVCYVVGNRTVKGIQLPTDQFTAWAFEQKGFKHVTTYIRQIPNKRMPSRNSPSNVTGKTSPTMNAEYLVVCRK